VRRIALLALLLPALAAGCGGGSKHSTTEAGPAAPRSKADYLAVADTICRNHQSRREDLESQARDLGPLTSKQKAHQVAALLRKESANRGDEVAELRRLRPPTADTATVDSILSLVGAESGLLGSWADAYDQGDAAAIRRLQIRLGLRAASAAQRARAYGFQVCGQQ
jgi:hypothetical protein